MYKYEKTVQLVDLNIKLMKACTKGGGMFTDGGFLKMS